MKPLIGGRRPGSSSYYRCPRGEIDGLLPAPMRSRPIPTLKRQQALGLALIIAAIGVPVALAGLIGLVLWLLS